MIINAVPAGGDQVCVDFDWAGLVSLVQLHMFGNFWLTSSCELSRLALLSQLKEVVFDDFDCVDKSMTIQLAQLAYRLGMDRRDVIFKVEYAVGLLSNGV